MVSEFCGESMNSSLITFCKIGAATAGGGQVKEVEEEEEEVKDGVLRADVGDCHANVVVGIEQIVTTRRIEGGENG